MSLLCSSGFRFLPSCKWGTWGPELKRVRFSPGSDLQPIFISVLSGLYSSHYILTPNPHPERNILLQTVLHYCSSYQQANFIRSQHTPWIYSIGLPWELLWSLISNLSSYFKAALEILVKPALLIQRNYGKTKVYCCNETNYLHRWDFFFNFTILKL